MKAKDRKTTAVAERRRRNPSGGDARPRGSKNGHVALSDDLRGGHVGELVTELSGWPRHQPVNGSGDAATADREASLPPLAAMAVHVEATVEPLPRRLRTVCLAGVDLHAVTEREVIDVIVAELAAGRGGTVITPNLDHLHRAQRNVTFSALLAEADLVVADGMPLVWASRLKGCRLPERVAGSNLIVSLSGAAAEKGRSVFLLGGDPGTADGAARILQERCPGLRVTGTHCPPVGFEYDPSQMAAIVEKLKASRPDIVFVALGSPKQEQLINRLRKVLPGAWWLGVGISFSFLTGQVRRAPRWMQSAGLEWVHRLAQEPKRLFRRYVMVGIPFAISLMGRSVWERVLRHAGLPEQRPIKRHVGDLRVVEPSPDDRARLDADANVQAVEEAAGRREEPADLEVPSGPEQRDNPPDGSAQLRRLRGMILLGGKVRPNAFTRCTGRPILELPISDNERLVDHWLKQADGVAKLAGLSWLPVRIVVSDESDAPSYQRFTGGPPRPADTFTVERDLGDYRGTGGVLHDLAGHPSTGYDDDDVLLVCNAAQLLIDPLAAIVRALAHKGADVSMIAHEDGTPSGIMLLSCKTLRQIPGVGYVDFKEQALPRIAQRWSVKAVRCRRPTALPVRSLEGYIAALQRHHDQLAGRGRGGEPDPLAENLAKHFALVEPEAHADPRAYLHDSVVLEGGRVEQGATLVRCVVCPGAVVGRDQRVVDTVVTPQLARASA